MDGRPGIRRLQPLAVAVALLVVGGCASGRAVLRGADGTPYPPAEPKVEEIYHIPTGVRLSLEGTMEMLAAQRVIYVGELHSSLNAHRVQRTIIEELDRRFPGRVAIGMEMFREGQQPALDRWVRGELSEDEFLKESKWFENWGSDYGYYREILAYARDHRLDVIALNPSRELQAQVRMSGLDKLSPELRARVPEADLSDPYHRASLEAIFGGHMPVKDSRFDGFYGVQTLWEETMAQRVVDYLGSPSGENKRMVVLAGGWHVAYGFGVPKRVLRRKALPYAIVLPEELGVPAAKQEDLSMPVVLPELPLLKGDFMWMVPYADLEGRRVRLGIQMGARDGAVLVQGVEPGSLAERVGVLPGDVVISLDGQPVTAPGDLVVAIAKKTAGDRAALVLKRDGQPVHVGVVFPKPASE